MLQLPHALPDNLRLLLTYLLEALKVSIQFSDPTLLESSLQEVLLAEISELQRHFPHIDVATTFSSAAAFAKTLSSPETNPDLYFSITRLLKYDPSTRLDARLVSEDLVDDLIERLTRYFAHCPVLVRIGIFTTWLQLDPWPLEDEDDKAEEEASQGRRLAEVICGSSAPLLQKLAQLLADASRASHALQIVKDRIKPMSQREVDQVLKDCEQGRDKSLFKSIESLSIAAGSIGQGHLATLHDDTRVFVKIKRLGIAALMREEERLFNATKQGDAGGESPWHEVAELLVGETSFATELSNQRLLAAQWMHNASHTSDFRIEIVDIIAAYPEVEPSILVMRVAPGDTIGRASVRFPGGLNNAVAALNQLIHSFYANTLFYDATTKNQQGRGRVFGYAPADPHAANEMIYADPVTGKVTLTLLDTASICTITPPERNQIIDLFIAVLMNDASGIAEIMRIRDDEPVEQFKACAMYRHILTHTESASGDAGQIGNTRDGVVLRCIVKIVESTKLVLKRPALDSLLTFGKAQLQLLDTVSQFHQAHKYEMSKLNLRFHSLTQVMMSHVMHNTSRNRELARRAMSAFGDGARRKFKDSFQPWDWEADGRNGNKMWHFGM